MHKQIQEQSILEMVQQERKLQSRIGTKKLYKLLKNDLEPGIGRDKFFDILRKHGLLVKRKRKYATTTNSYHHFRKYKNKLKHVKLCRPNQAYVADITYIRVQNRFMYLFLLTDAYSRLIVGWNLSASLGIEGAVAALKMALKACPNLKGILHHSDRGIQYCCKEYITLLQANKMEISMTEENHCYENSLAERVNGILKDEYLLDDVFKSRRTAHKAVRQAIVLYNTKRPHWSLNLSTPMTVHHAA